MQDNTPRKYACTETWNHIIYNTHISFYSSVCVLVHYPQLLLRITKLSYNMYNIVVGTLK